MVLRTLMRLGARQDDVEDLAQEVFLVAHRRSGEFDRSRAAGPWLYGIARNIMRDYWRKNQGNRVELGKEDDAAESEPPQTFVSSYPQQGTQSDEVQLLRTAIAHLAEPLQDVLIFRDLMGMTLAETATELAISFDTAKDRLRRARGELRAGVELLEKEVVDD